MEIVAYLINTVLLVALVQYLKNVGMGWLKVNAPWSLPILAVVAAPLLTAASVALSGFIGYPIDFSALIAVLTAGSAVIAFDITHAITKKRA